MLTSGIILQNRYQIIQRLGGGGMGEVYLAYDLRLGNQQVVVKENRGGDPQLFYAEATILATLRHPSLPRVIDHFVDPPPPTGTGAQYLVMDYVAGQNLEQIVQTHGTLSERDALAWLNQILDAVQYLHANRIVHRDIKPQNIILTPDGRAVLVDFGIAKVMRPGQATFSAAHGIGSLGYSPLEQYTGGTNERSDIYALGATIYYALTGMEPPAAPDRANGVPLPPIRARNPNISPNTEQVIATAAAVMMGQRYPTVEAMRRALVGQPPAVAPMLPTVPPSAPSVALTMPVPASPAKRVWALGGAGAMFVVGLIVLVLCGVGVFAFLPGAAPTPTSVAAAVTTSAATPATATSALTPTAIPTTATAAPTPTAKPTVTPTPDANATVMVPAGVFEMGSFLATPGTDEWPEHTVDLETYTIDKFEVTNARYKHCVDAQKCLAPVSHGSSTRASYYDNLTYDNYPVIWVSWDDAEKFCEWSGERLPTEAEWEKAARGTDGRVFPWGDTFNKDLLNSLDGGRGDTTPVGSYPNGASPHGAMDMAGNVWEWVADWFGGSYYQESSSKNPKGPTIGAYRVLRGGAFSDVTNGVRSAFRDITDLAFDEPRGSNIGFRCARSQ